MYHCTTYDAVKAGKITDIYFARTREILKAEGLDKRVKAEFIAKNLPEDWTWAVLAGLEEVGTLADGMKVDIRAMAEGTVFRPWEPVLEIEGMYTDFCVYETAILGLICQASGIATMAARCRLAAGERPITSFGARRMHPILAPLIERNAFIGGCDGVSVGEGAELIGQPPTGTMPHALVLMYGDTVEATKAFDRVVLADVKRISLIDTFQDEKFEAIRVASALGDRLYGVRLDTPGSRRGDFKRIAQEVRWELDLRGFTHVKIFVSGGIGERQIREMNPVVDGYGVGTAISDAPVVDFSMDIVEIDGVPLAKRGKPSGAKQVYRCQLCHRDRVTPQAHDSPVCECGGQMEGLLNRWIERGSLVGPLPSAVRIRQRVLEQLRWIGSIDERQSSREPAPERVEERATGAVAAASTVAG
ncbi:MAG: nicotinate phosphoribosyltransferase [candidate division NC10 bacterium]|nr:nicotinate phosphoribosyltransferase [candidate division NC10 bacterium]